MKTWFSAPRGFQDRKGRGEERKIKWAVPREQNKLIGKFKVPVVMWLVLGGTLWSTRTFQQELKESWWNLIWIATGRSKNISTSQSLLSIRKEKKTQTCCEMQLQLLVAGVMIQLVTECVWRKGAGKGGSHLRLILWWFDLY